MACSNNAISHSASCNPATATGPVIFWLAASGSENTMATPLKAGHALSMIAALMANAIQVQADEASPTRRAFAQLNYRSLGTTMNKGVELADKGDYEKARKLFDAAIAQDP